jgi:hypothetical protein
MESSRVELSDLLAAMNEPPEDSDGAFYAFTLTADPAGQVFFDTQTIWAGYADEDQRVELRAARLVNLRMAEVWASLGRPYVFVHNADQFLIFTMIGGNALVVPAVAEESVPEWLAPQPSYQTGLRGFVSPELADPSSLKRAPSPKLRMKVLSRDRRRCRICGRNPDDNVDLTLHVHHIRPWARRGLTEMSNLITLCHTCHAGLEPHFDPSLFSYLESDSVAERTAAFLDGIINYRRVTSPEIWHD